MQKEKQSIFVDIRIYILIQRSTSLMKIIVLLLCMALAAYSWQAEEVDAACDPPVLNCLTCDNDNTCTDCTDGHYLDENNQCPSCSDKISNCTSCKTVSNSSSVNCYECSESLFPSSDFQECKLCKQVIEHCDTCELAPTGSNFNANPNTQCQKCSQGYDLSDDKFTCSQSSSASTIIIVSAVVGGVVLIGAGFAIFKCMNKRKKGSRLLQDQ